MATINKGTIQVFTYKEGLLSAVAHDLRLTLGRFEVQREGADVTGRFWPGTLAVDGAVKGGTVDPTALSAKDKGDIADNIKEKVLHTDRFPEITFAGKIAVDAPVSRIDGKLTMAGQQAPLAVSVQRDAGRYRGELELVPSKWGIAPFKALMGTIKIQDRVRVVFDLPADE